MQLILFSLPNMRVTYNNFRQGARVEQEILLNNQHWKNSGPGHQQIKQKDQYHIDDKVLKQVDSFVYIGGVESLIK